MRRPPKRPEGRGKIPRPQTDTGGQRPRDDRPRGERSRGDHAPDHRRGEKPRAGGEGPRASAEGPRASADKPRGSAAGPRANAEGLRASTQKPRASAARSHAPRGEAPQEDRPRRGPPRAAAPRHAEPAIETAGEPPRPGAGAGSGAYWIYGQHAVVAALSNPLRKPRRLLATAEAEAALKERFSGPWRVTPERSERSRFGTFLAEDAVHQGIALLAEPLEPVALEDAIEAAQGPVLLLDQVTDPRNVGAALRAAAAFGAAAVVLQDRHAPPETGALARAASGTLDIVPVVREVNLSRAIATLQKNGFWVLGLAGEGKRTLAEAAPRDRRVALVLGAEDSGLRRLQRETCDELVRLPMAEGVESLNVSAAAAVALYEIVRR